MLRLHSLKAYNVLEKKEGQYMRSCRNEKKKNPKIWRRGKKNKDLLLGCITHLKIRIHALKSHTSIAYKQFKK